jgi:DNA invertase Pin-like site-specific DNA recombinase
MNDPVFDGGLAAVYRRVSTDQQDASLETQEKRVGDYLAFKGLTATEQTTFHDADTSGSVAILDRPGGARLFATLRHCPQIKHLVVAKLDRLGRSARDLLDTVHQLNGMGVTLHIVDMGGDNLSTQGPAGKLMFVILAGMAEFERELIRGRIQDALDRRFDQRCLIGTPPYGFDLEECGKSPKTGKPLYRLVDNYAEQEIIRRIARQRGAGCSFKQIADQLNADGIPTKTGKSPWQCGNVAGVLQSKHTARFLDEQEALVLSTVC